MNLIHLRGEYVAMLFLNRDKSDLSLILSKTAWTYNLPFHITVDSIHLRINQRTKVWSLVRDE